MTKEEKYHLYYSWIEACQRSDRLSEWEEEFINSIFEQLTKKGSISSRQSEILERIYTNKTY